MHPSIIESLGRDRCRQLAGTNDATSHEVVAVIPPPRLPFHLRATARLGAALISFGCRLTRPSLVTARRLQGSW